MRPNKLVSLIKIRILALTPLSELVAISSACATFAFRCNRPEKAVNLSTSSSLLLLAPLQELAKQSLSIGLGLWSTASETIQKRLEIATDVILG
jgi:hypothetical protein